MYLRHAVVMDDILRIHHDLFFISIIHNIRYTSKKSQTRFLKTYLFRIDERFRRYAHLTPRLSSIVLQFDLGLEKVATVDAL